MPCSRSSLDVAENPDAGMRHLDDRRDALGGAEPEHRHVDGRRERIAVERDDLERVPGNARLRFSVALPLTTWNSTRSPFFTRIGSPWPSMPAVDRKDA